MTRQEQLTNLQSYLQEVDKDITMILQNLQWDRSVFSKEQSPLSKCKYNQNHKVSSNKLREHEEICFLKENGYSSEVGFLPELLNINGLTVAKFSSNVIKEIIDNAAEKDPLFKRGCNSEAIPPLSAARLQTTYTADERRAIHDAVVSSVRTTQSQYEDEFVIPSGGSGPVTCDKSLLEQLAEQRDRRRRRTKYRAPPKTRNYSLVLRDVISSQMELLSELRGNSEVVVKKEIDENSKYENIDSYNEDANISLNSRNNLEEYSHKNVKQYDKYAENNESRRSYKDHKDVNHQIRHHSRTDNKRSKDYTNVKKLEGAKNSRNKEDFYRERENSRLGKFYTDKEKRSKDYKNIDNARNYRSNENYYEDRGNSIQDKDYTDRKKINKDYETINDARNYKNYEDSYTESGNSREDKGYTDKGKRNKDYKDVEESRSYRNKEDFYGESENSRKDKYYTDREVNKNNYRNTQEFCNEIGNKRHGSSKEKSKHKEYRGDRKHKKNTSSDRKNRELDERYEGYTERDRYSSNDRKRWKYDLNESDEDGSYITDYKKRKHY